ncbi:MAG: ASKHA domain-containing protein, partial [Pseudomonadota bacterium]
GLALMCVMIATQAAMYQLHRQVRASAELIAKLYEGPFDPHLLGGLQTTLRQADWYLTVAVFKNDRIVGVWPGLKERVYGVACDIGSTTIAAHLCDLTTGQVVASGGIMNPQIRFGEDLMSRVSYVMMHPEGTEEMTQVVRQGVQQLIEEIVANCGAVSSDVMEVAVVGNPIMHHLFFGISPIELGGAPFALAVDTALEVKGQDIELRLNPGARVYALPCIAGHVGADCAAMVLSEEPQLHEEVTLLVDVGTNAEIVLGNRDRLLACSSPTGPAFEGAQISCGQRAAPGAIERVRIDPKTLDVKVRVIGSDVWSDEPDFAASIDKFGVTGICGSGIIEAVAEMFLAGAITADGVIRPKDNHARFVQSDRTWSFVLCQYNEMVISVSQNDVRQIQLAKAALYAGVKLLMDKSNVQTVDRIRLAGAFGSHIDVKHAMVLGLIPDCDLDQVASAGNAAGTGARIALLNSQARSEIETLVRSIEKIETAVEDKFQEYFVGAMAIPHKTDGFPRLFSVVDPPPKSEPPVATETRRRRRRRSQGG